MYVLSVAVPAYNEGERLPPLLDELVAIAARSRCPPTEILVIDDGSATEHRERYRAAVASAASVLADAKAPHRIELLTAPANQGKGAAIRLGWSRSHASARWLGFVDADGAIPAGEFWRLARLLDQRAQFGVVAGSRILMAGRRIRRSLFRHFQGRVFATLTERAFRLGFYDTQCGLKFVRADLLRPHLGELHETQWLLDIELLAIVQRAGARCVEEPIDWADPGGSKMTFGLDAARMLLGLHRIRKRLERDGVTQRFSIVTGGQAPPAQDADTGFRPPVDAQTRPR